MNYTWKDYSGLVRGQEANSVANKSEYIRKEYALGKSLKGLKYKKQKKTKMNVLQSLWRESEEAWKIYNLSLLFV